MGAIFALSVVTALILLAVIGVQLAKLYFLFGVIVPYAAFVIFTIGIIYRVTKWGRSPVPFHIPTTGGQQKSFPWIKHSRFDNPSSTTGVMGRMALEVLMFRSLFRNTKSDLSRGPRLAHRWEKWLWFSALAFHWAFLIVLIRHFRFFFTPVPSFLYALESIDGFFQIGAPGLMMTGVILLVSATYLLIRRFYIPQMRYISLANDYFPLFLIIAIAVTGIGMRHFAKIDVVDAKTLIMGLLTFNPKLPLEGIGLCFYLHLFLVSTLFAYFPFSKLVHMAGVFMSPTRNLANNSRVKRHVNPWNYPVRVHTYEEYEDDFREKMKMAEIPVEKE